MSKEFTGIASERAMGIASEVGFLAWVEPTNEEKDGSQFATKVLACNEARYIEYMAACESAGISADERGHWCYPTTTKLPLGGNWSELSRRSCPRCGREMVTRFNGFRCIHCSVVG